MDSPGHPLIKVLETKIPITFQEHFRQLVNPSTSRRSQLYNPKVDQNITKFGLLPTSCIYFYKLSQWSIRIPLGLGISYNNCSSYKLYDLVRSVGGVVQHASIAKFQNFLSNSNYQVSRCYIFSNNLLVSKLSTLYELVLVESS